MFSPGFKKTGHILLTPSNFVIPDEVRDLLNAVWGKLR